MLNRSICLDCVVVFSVYPERYADNTAGYEILTHSQFQLRMSESLPTVLEPKEVSWACSRTVQQGGKRSLCLVPDGGCFHNDQVDWEELMTVLLRPSRARPRSLH